MTLIGIEAIEYAEANGLALNAYANEVDGPEGREGLTPAEARKIAAEDPSLIYANVDGGQVAMARTTYTCTGDLNDEVKNRLDRADASDCYVNEDGDIVLMGEPFIDTTGLAEVR